MQPQKAFLHDVFRVGAAARDAIGQCQHRRAEFGESLMQVAFARFDPSFGVLTHVLALVFAQTGLG
jgi:hypothetical protein